MTTQLPPNPSLQQLRYQAKERLKARKQEDPDTRVGLQECQHALAVDYGFKTWAALKSHVESIQVTSAEKHSLGLSPTNQATCKHPLIGRTLREAVEREASDVHLVAGEPLMFRRGGKIERSDSEALSADDILAAATAQFGDDIVERVKKTGGVRAGCGLPGVIRAEATATMASGSMRIVIRIADNKVLDYREAGLPQAILDVAAQTSGLVVFAGQQGSGFQTSAMSFIDYINQTRPVHILTIEDPISTELTPKKAIVQQREVGTDIPDIVSAIRLGVEQDVDVLYVAALRATQELVAAITAAEVGKLVVIPVHGSSFDEAMERIISAFPAGDRPVYRKRLARVLSAISVQTLVAGKDKTGRVADYEVLIPDDITRKAIEKGESLEIRLPGGSQDKRIVTNG